MPEMMQDRAFQQRMGRIEDLVQEIESVADPASRAAIKELVASVMELNAVGFHRVLETASRYGETGSRLVESLLRDDAVACLLILYGLHPQDLETRVRNAVNGFDGVEVISLQDAVLHLHLERGVREAAVQEAVYGAAPDLAELIMEGPGQTGFVPLSALAGKAAVTRP